jgi:hypothetical protein
MNQEKTRETYQKMLKKCPEILTCTKATKWSTVGKNTIYAAIQKGELEAFVYKRSYIFTKDAFIDYLVRTSNDTGRKFARAGEKRVK